MSLWPSHSRTQEKVCIPQDKHSLTSGLVHTAVFIWTSALNFRVRNQDTQEESVFKLVHLFVFPNSSKILRGWSKSYTEGTQQYGEFLDLGSTSEQWLRNFIRMELSVQRNTLIYA